MSPGGASRIFALRRTNLVLMAYSKYHHGGCDVYIRQGPQGAPKGPEGFDLDVLLRCVEHYTLWEQEYSSSAALQITQSVLPHRPWPFLVVYEDVLADGGLVQSGIQEYLGIQIQDTANMFQDNARTHKEHADPICEYKDVNCTALAPALRRDYPCLYAQLTRAAENLVWSVPMFTNGTISMHGTCHPIAPLSVNRYVQTVCRSVSACSRGHPGAMRRNCGWVGQFF